MNGIASVNVSGNLKKSLPWKPWAIDFEMIYLVSMVIFNSYLKLPEGTIILKRCTLHLWPSNNKEAMGKSWWWDLGIIKRILSMRHFSKNSSCCMSKNNRDISKSGMSSLWEVVESWGCLRHPWIDMSHTARMASGWRFRFVNDPWCPPKNQSWPIFHEINHPAFGVSPFTESHK